MKDWANYFVLTGTGAVTLIGLLFVVMTLGAERTERGDERLLRTFLSPTVVHFGVVFLEQQVARISEAKCGNLQRGI